MKGCDKMKKFIMCLLTTLILNQPTYASDLKEMELSILDDKTKAVKVFESMEDVDFKNVIFADFEKDNFKYSKDKVNIDRITKEDVKEQEETITKIITKQDKQKLNNEQLLSLFEDTLTYDKEEYKGILQKDLTSLKVEPNKTESTTTYTNQTVTLNENKTYYGLESNDYGLIPKTITKNGVTLNLVNANFVSTNNEAISTVANTGVGTLYNCNTTYKGSYTKKIPNTKTNVIDYKVSVKYKGNISKEVFEKNIITVTYDGEKLFDPTIPVEVATTTSATGFFGFIVFLFTKRNVKIYNLNNGIYELIGKCKITEKNKNINLNIISIKAKSNIYKLLLDKSIAKKLNNQDINITLDNVTKIQKVEFKEDNTYIDVTF